MTTDLTQLSKFVSLILRHKPETIGITLDENGWANVIDLITGIQNSNKKFDRQMLDEIVKTDSKGRYEYNDNCDKIRATQGHSINVELDFIEIEPPSTLYHGTVNRFIENIKQKGLVKGNRQFVHLSESIQTAQTVGNRRGTPVILSVAAKQMHQDGIKFYKSKNNVFLVKYVAPKYLTILTESETADEKQ